MLKRAVKAILVLAIVGGLSVTAIAAQFKTNNFDVYRSRSKDYMVSCDVSSRKLTDEQKLKLVEKAKERLSQSLADEKITQEQYDKAISALEEGKLPFGKGKSERGNHNGGKVRQNSLQA